MLAERDVMPLLVEVCCSYELKWQYLLQVWAKEKDRAGMIDNKYLLYPALSDLVAHLIERYKQGDTFEIRKVFETAEFILNEGSRYAKEAIAIGLIKHLQNACAEFGLDYAHFEPFLLPLCRLNWDHGLNEWESRVKRRIKQSRPRS
ncbi:hypothetical protein MASR2M15_26970 [Anaerolineales bacterium]